MLEKIPSNLLTKLKTDNPTLLSELEQKNNEINTLKTQSQKLREEANAQSNPNAKIGALSNAEEKEAEYLIKQNQLIAELKKQYPDYVVTPLNNNNEINKEFIESLSLDYNYNEKYFDKKNTNWTAVTKRFFFG